MQDIEKIYKEYFETVNKYLFCLTRNNDISEELTQETFYKAVKKIDTYKGECKISVWLCQIAKNLWYDECRKNKKIITTEEDLLPNYIEKLTNEETNKYIEEHLKSCNECKKVLQNMNKELKVDNEKRSQKEVKYIKKFSNRLKVLKSLVVITLVIALAVMTGYYFNMKNAYVKAVTHMVGIVSEGIYPDTFYATIEEISDLEVYGIKTIKVKGLDINDINHRGEFTFDVILDNIPDNFKLKWRGTNITFKQLKVGQTIAVYNYGEIQETEPANLSTVRMIVVLDDIL